MSGGFNTRSDMRNAAANSWSDLPLRAFAMQSESPDGENRFRRILDALPAAVYTTDAAGRITYYNQAAVDLWGCQPVLHQSEWCGSWKLFWPDGRPMPHGECPMALAVKEQRAIRGMEAIAERPDGTRVIFVPFPTPIFDEAGALTGAVNMLVDITDRKQDEIYGQRLAAIVESSDDAIVSKDLNGVITSWNAGAERLFGYTQDEIIGKPITILIPPERLDEEPGILQRIRRGERIDHYETIRRRKDGSLIEVSLTVSPIKDAAGRIVGASKIGRDITERRRAQEQQEMLLGEMKHRARNLATVIDALGRQSRPRNDPAIEAFFGTFMGRLRALLSTGEIVLDSQSRRADLRRLVDTTLQPFVDSHSASRIAVSGPALSISEQTAGSLALALHELATNALKYGALKSSQGTVTLGWSIARDEEGDRVAIEWKEHTPHAICVPQSTGFGSRVIAAAVSGEPGGRSDHRFEPDGLRCRFEFKLS
jgi:PAS domain S-box-containing protein